MCKKNKLIVPENITDIRQEDALCELRKIAAAHAATALSELLTEKILIDVSESHILPIEKIYTSIGQESSEQHPLCQVD